MSKQTRSTPIDAKDFYVRCLQQATEVVQHYETAYINNPTPDTDWTVGDLLRHTLYELEWTADIVKGKTLAEVGTAHDNIKITDNVIDDWQAAAERARRAIRSASLQGPAHLSFDDTTVEHYLWQAGGDQLIHAWDLAEGMGVVMQFDPELAQAVYDASEPHQDMLAGTGLFAPPIKVPNYVDIQTKLLALFGRSLNWRYAHTS